jgi:hypothetical protein
MTVKQLRERLLALPGTFTLAGTEVGIAAVEQLFDASLPHATLTLANATAVGGKLAANGTITLAGVGGGGPLPASVSFTADGDENVSGLEILVTLESWQIATASLTVDLRPLAALKFRAARLVLAAPAAVAAAELGAEADLQLGTTAGTQTITLRGLKPPPLPPGAPLPTSLWEFGAHLTGISLSDLGRLAVLGSGLSGSAFGVPSQVPLAGAVDLTDLRVVVDMDAKVIVAATVDVGLADSWKIVPGKCELTELRAAFTITYPAISPRVSAALLGTLEIAGVAVAASLTVPALELVAELLEPVDAGKVLAQYSDAAASLPLEVQRLMLSVDAGDSVPAWRVALAVGEGARGAWSLAGDVELEDVKVELAGVGSTPRSATMTATFALGDTATAVLGGAWDATTGWKLSGNTVSTDGLAIGPLLEVFATRFHAPLPAVLAQLELTRVAMTVATHGPSFTFEIAGRLALGPATAEVVVGAAVTGHPFVLSAKGQLTLAVPRHGKDTETMTFDVAFDKDATKTSLSGHWSDTPGVSLEDVAGYLGVDVSAIPSALLPDLTSIALGYASDGPIVALGVDTAETRSVWAVTGATRAGFAAITARTPFRLSRLPVVGHAVPSADDLGIDAIGLLAGSAPLTPEVAKRIDALVAVPEVTLPAMPAAGLYLSVAYVVGGSAQPPLTLEIGGGGQSQLASPALAPGTGLAPGAQLASPALATGTGLVAPASGVGLAASEGGPPTAWLQLQRSFGPVELRRAGVSYDDGAVWLLLDGALHAGPLILGLEGLGAGFVLGGSDPWEPKFALAGMSVVYSAPPVAIAGAILDVPPSGNVTFELAGLLAITAEAFSLTVFGAYAEVAGSPSMFLFGAAGAEFGGPPSFFVTGLAAGFGYNSTLRFPRQDEVAEFPLVAGLADPASFAKQDPLKVLGSLVEGADPLVQWQLGDLWFAAGLKFSTYELLSTTAVLVVEVGQELAVALIGTSEASFPLPAGDGGTAGPQYARLVLGLEALFRPTDGTFLATAVVQKGSYVIDPACALSGGFAFAIWFPPSDHAGDFILTLGGYHAAFRPPAWYPREPRLGFSWSYSDKLAISGTAYLALTPAALMAGGSLDVKFHSGSLHASLTAHADAIAWWHPFRFSIDFGVTVRASYHGSVLGISSTFSAELGADMSLWGPPTSGKVTIHWWVISFTIHFGSHNASDRKPLKQWSSATEPAFDQLLPAANDALVVAPVAGVSKPQWAAQQSLGDRAMTGSDTPWIVSAYGFRFVTRIAVPASTVQAGSFAQDGPKLDIRPMERTGLTSTHKVRLLRGSTDVDLATWTIAAVVQSGPKALWGTGPGSRPPAGDDQLVPGQLTGIAMTAPAPVAGATPGPVADAADLERDPLTPAGWLSIAAGTQPPGPLAVADPGSIATIAAQIASNPGRDALHQAMVALGAADATLPNGSMTTFLAGHAFEDPPMVVRA